MADRTDTCSTGKWTTLKAHQIWDERRNRVVDAIRVK